MSTTKPQDKTRTPTPPPTPHPPPKKKKLAGALSSDSPGCSSCIACCNSWRREKTNSRRLRAAEFEETPATPFFSKGVGGWGWGVGGGVGSGFFSLWLCCAHFPRGRPKKNIVPKLFIEWTAGKEKQVPKLHVVFLPPKWLVYR